MLDSPSSYWTPSLTLLTPCLVVRLEPARRAATLELTSALSASEARIWSISLRDSAVTANIDTSDKGGLWQLTRKYKIFNLYIYIILGK